MRKQPCQSRRLYAQLCLPLELLLDLATSLDALQYALTVLVELQLGDNNLRRVDAEGDGLSGGLLLDDSLDVDYVLETVDGSDLAFATLVGASNDENLIVLSNWDGADVVLLAELLAEGCAHDCTSHA